MHRFIGAIKPVIRGGGAIQEKLAALRPHFSRLLADPKWLPEEFRHASYEGRMGTGAANWLLYRDTDGTLTLSALVLPPGGVTPVHDHLAWGLVGLYSGEQDEEVYETAAPVGPGDRHTEIHLVKTNHLKVGSFYELIPPSGDIHRVITTSKELSISLHLLSNDVGCVPRHRFEPQTGMVSTLLTGYTNQQCDVVEEKII